MASVAVNMTQTIGVRVACLCRGVLPTTGQAQGEYFIWNLDGDGFWNLGTNWNHGFEPNSASANALIRNAFSSDAVAVTLDPRLVRDVLNLTIDDKGENPDHELFIANNAYLV